MWMSGVVRTLPEVEDWLRTLEVEELCSPGYRSMWMSRVVESHWEARVE